jgi:hypothetical protein
VYQACCIELSCRLRHTLVSTTPYKTTNPSFCVLFHVFILFSVSWRLHCNRENTVTACLKCNGKKGSLTLQELRMVGMKLEREPLVPTQHELSAIAAKLMPRRVHPQWAPYLGMPKMNKKKKKLPLPTSSSSSQENNN